MAKALFEEMRGKTALVTGATSGIGASAVFALVEQGVQVAFVGRRQQEGKGLEKKITDLGGKGLFIQADVSQAKSVQKMLKKATDAFGPLHYILNNAGIEGTLAPLHKLEEKDFDELMGINLKGVWLCLKYQLESLEIIPR